MLDKEASKLMSGMTIKHDKNPKINYRVLGCGQMKVNGKWIKSVTYQATTGMGMIFTRSLLEMHNFYKV